MSYFILAIDGTRMNKTWALHLRQESARNIYDVHLKIMIINFLFKKADHPSEI